MALTDKLTAIGNALRQKLHTAEKFTLAQMPEKVAQVYQKAEADFWEKVPVAMERHHFAGDAWNVDNFYPRGYYVCASSSPQYLFAYHNRRHEAYDFEQRLAQCGAELDFSGATRIDYGFYYANITVLPELEFGHMIRLLATFSGCSALHTIRKLTVGEITEFSQAFAGCTALENLTIAGTIGQNGLDVSECPLTRESLLSILAALKAGVSGLTVTLGESNLAKLTEAEKAIATDKGWQLL